MPFKLFLLASLFKKLLQSRHAFFPRAVGFGKLQAVLANLLFAPFPGPAVLLVKFLLMVQVEPFDDGNFLVRQRGNPTDDFLVTAAFLKIGHQVQDGDAAGRKLLTAAAIDNRDFASHGFSFASWEKRISAFY